MTDFSERSLELHRRLHGKLSVQSKVPLLSRDDLSLAYTPGVARPCEVIAADPSTARELTIKRNSVAVVTDGSAVLGLGNIGPLAALPVMEGKAVLFKQFADIDAWPICLATQDADEIVATVRNIAPGFGGINLEDIGAPQCFEVEARLQDLGIPVFHDDQHGTAIVLLAALLNASKVVGRPFDGLKVVINGAGAAGIAIARLLAGVGQEGADYTPVSDIVMCDSRGIIHAGRDDLNEVKKQVLAFTNAGDLSGDLATALRGADVFIGVSRGNLLRAEHVQTMAPDSIVLALANPIPEIMPDEAVRGGAAVVGTGRSDFPNQVNNVLVFPGIFRGALDAMATCISEPMKAAAAIALAKVVENPTAEQILPEVLDRRVAPAVAAAVVKVLSDKPAA